MAREMRKVAVIGRGKMGSGIAAHLLKHDLDLVWICRRAQDEEGLRAQVRKRLKRLRRGEQLDDQAATDKLESTVVASSLAAARGCDLVIEAIAEDSMAKRRLFRELATVVPPDCILASNTSSIDLGELSRGLAGEERFAGLHFFDPVAWKVVVEINTTGCTSSETRLMLAEFVGRIGKQALVLEASGNFLLNRIASRVQNYAYHFLQEGVLSVAEIDELARHHLFPIGPFEFMDAVGPEILLAALHNYGRQDDLAAFYAPLRRVLEEQVGTAGRFYGGAGAEAGGEASRAPHAAYAQNLVEVLAALYANGALEAVDQGHCGTDEIDHAMREYFGAERGPLKLAREIGPQRLHRVLDREHKISGCAVFRPSPGLDRLLPAAAAAPDVALTTRHPIDARSEPC